MAEADKTNTKVLNAAVTSLISQLDPERERAVITSRFGLNGERLTLEQVGESLGITRERVRQIEKATLIRLRLSLDDGKNAAFIEAEMAITKALHELGRGARIEKLSHAMVGDHNAMAAISLLAEISNKMIITTENNSYYAAVILTADKTERDIRKDADALVAIIKQAGEPLTAEQLFDKTAGRYEHPSEAVAIASVSKKIATLYNLWGLVSWPIVNPRNIRDKIYVVLRNHDAPLHFSDIAEAVKAQNFKRNNISEQAIHNELIKDKRFVLIGRGIYALAERGYQAGSIADVITALLKQNGPMNREDIVRQVLKVRKVREATVLLNLQSKPQFKRAGDAKYQLVQTH